MQLLPAISTARAVPILANPLAGSRESKHDVEALVRAIEAKGMAPLLCRHPDALSELANRDRIRCVVAAGGDGTIMAVLNRLPGVPVLPFPLGNENLVARYLGIPRSPTAVAEMIAQGKTKRFDMGRANDRLFSLMAGVGFDADVVHRVHRNRNGHINKWSWVIPIVQSLTHFSYPRVHVEIADTGERMEASMLFVVNIPRYAMSLPIAPDAAPNDGWLDLCVFTRPGPWNLARSLAAVVFGRQQTLPGYQRRRVKKLSLSCAEAVPMQTDGDPAGELPTTIEVVPASMLLVVP